MNDLVSRSQWGRRARVVHNLFTLPAPQRPVVLIQSDDWGRCGMPSPRCLEPLREAGLDVGRSPWDWYGLESVEDLERLGARLEQIRDRDGNPACITANFVMANADLRRMREQGYNEFLWKPIAEGFPEPWTDHLMPVYRDLVARGVFYPGLHGFTHFNAPSLMSALRDPGPGGERARLLADNDIPYLASQTPTYNFALADTDRGEHALRSADEQAAWLAQGVEFFTHAFGFEPMTFCAPGYRADHVTRIEAVRQGIRVKQTAGRTMPIDEGGCLVIVRNVYFEPVLEGRPDMPALMSAAHRACVSGIPIVICTHSINYISRFNNQAETSTARLADLLERLLQRYPDLIFANDTWYEQGLRGSGPLSFAQPDASQVAARLRYFATVLS